jgi:hypothetical protein
MTTLAIVTLVILAECVWVRRLDRIEDQQSY